MRKPGKRLELRRAEHLERGAAPAPSTLERVVVAAAREARRIAGDRRRAIALALGRVVTRERGAR